MDDKNGLKCRIVSFVILLIFSTSHLLQFPQAATDTISPGRHVTYSETLVSANQTFELGFFRPGNSLSYYLGIWYKQVSEKTVVWVGNRDYASFTSAALLSISNDGNLVILEGNVYYKLTNLSLNGNVSATLLDSGNLVLKGEDSDILWQSFDFPTDTWLPGMKFGYDKTNGRTWSLQSWRSINDPSPGNFTLELDPNGTDSISVMNGLQLYWTSGQWNDQSQVFSFYNGIYLNSSNNITFISDHGVRYFVYESIDKNVTVRVVMDVSGQIKTFVLVGSAEKWNMTWINPRQVCEVYAYCGTFGSCSSNSCGCFQGFEPRSKQHWNDGDYSEGCSRITDLQCSNNDTDSEGARDGFIMLSNMILPADAVTNFEAQNIDECLSSCLNNCSCNGYSYDNKSCKVWVGDLLNAVKLTNDDARQGRSFNLKLAAADLVTGKENDSGKKRQVLLIAVTTSVSLIVFSSGLALLIFRVRRNQRKRKGEADLLSFDFSVTPEPGATRYEQAEVKRPSKNNKEVEIQLFSFSSVSAATNCFSASNKLGEGGFGPVYKGKLLKGHEVAVKRLSRRSGQGWDELKNEAMLIAKLQHKNLVKLLGCCIEGDEKILIYEYLPNKSLDFFLFDPAKNAKLDWSTRVRIVEGIAQGLLYLHQFSRLQIIHRDLKASNILLDEDMNPKISDFGMARIFGSNEPIATNRIVGTYGYMAPEYALEGVFSVKSDIFSFGVLLLEILSGKKNTGFYQSSALNLVGHAWDLWTSNRPLELMDPSLQGTNSCASASASASAGLRYINIALVCVQEHAFDRPTISDVVMMLSNELTFLPSPKKPAFSSVRSLNDPTPCDSRPVDVCSINGATISVLEAR